MKGWNLPCDQLTLNTASDGDNLRKTTCRKETLSSNAIAYAVDTLPECNEIESNDIASMAQRIDLPKMINGRIGKPGDMDVFRFKGQAGESLVAEVYARRLNSPVDSMLKLTDESGNVIVWNDDYAVQDNYLYKDALGTVTHSADSYLSVELKKTGIYYIHVGDSQQHGGDTFGYRLRIAPPQPGFELRVIPSSLSVMPGGNVPMTLYVLRKDGFKGEIDIRLKNAPAGFKISGGRIPAESDHIRMTLTTFAGISDQTMALQLEGGAVIAGQSFSCSIVPADDMMQAFLYRHLVPTQELLVSVAKTRWNVPAVELVNHTPIRIIPDSITRVWIKTKRRPMLRDIQLKLDNPPKGLTLEGTVIGPEGLKLELKADPKIISADLKDNLIIEMLTERAPMQKGGNRSDQKQLVSMGYLPAIPIEIVKF